MAGVARIGGAWRSEAGVARCVEVWWSLVRQAWMGLAGIGWVRPGNDRQGRQGMSEQGMEWQGRHGSIGNGSVGYSRHF